MISTRLLIAATFSFHIVKGRKWGKLNSVKSAANSRINLQEGGSVHLIQYAALRCIPFDSSEQGMAISPTFVSCALPVCYAYGHGVAHAVTFLARKENPT